MSPPLDSLVEWRCLILGNGLAEGGGAEGGSWHCFPKEDEELFTSNTGVEVRLVGLVTGDGSSKVVGLLPGLFSKGRRLESDFEGLIEGNRASFNFRSLTSFGDPAAIPL